MSDIVGPFKEPKVEQTGWCRCGWHTWKQLRTFKGAGRRGVIMRRGCTACGKVQIYQIAGLCGRSGWTHWGYLHPDDLDMSLDEVVAKYVPDHPSLQNK